MHRANWRLSVLGTQTDDWLLRSPMSLWVNFCVMDSFLLQRNWKQVYLELLYDTHDKNKTFADMGIFSNSIFTTQILVDPKKIWSNFTKRTIKAWAAKRTPISNNSKVSS